MQPSRRDRQLVCLALALSQCSAASATKHSGGLRQKNTPLALSIVTASDLASLKGKDVATHNVTAGSETKKAEDYVATFQATGCPNQHPDVAWWKTQADDAAIADMYSSCSLTKSGTANHAQRIQCCGQRGQYGLFGSAEGETKCSPETCTKQPQLRQATLIQSAEWHKFLPKTKHADSLSVATDGYLDWFMVIYWTIIVLIIGASELGSRCVSVFHRDSDDMAKRRSSLRFVSQTGEGVSRQTSKHSTAMTDTATDFLLGDDDAEPRSGQQMQENFWAFNLIASIGNARDKKGRFISPWIVYAGTLLMGFVQIATLFIICYDIDPEATPFTVIPSSPWKTTAHTVNIMKFIMVFYLGLSVVAEAGDAYDNYTASMNVDASLLLVNRKIVLFFPVFHYIITLTVILAGVSVILSCQAVPEILTSAMAILFITQVDELLWYFFEKTFDVYVENDWQVPGRKEEMSSAGYEHLLKKCIIMFPMLWGFCLLGRAWYRNQMPALIVRVLASN